MGAQYSGGFGGRTVQDAAPRDPRCTLRPVYPSTGVAFDRVSRRVWVVVACLFVALHAALFALGLRPEPRRLHGDEGMYWQAAERLLEGGGSDLEPLWPPLYAWFVAGIRFLHDTAWAVEAVQVLLLLAAALLLRDLTRRLERPAAAADGAAVLMLLYPTLAAFAHFLWPEVLHLLWLIAAVWILVARRRSLAWCALLGVVLGAALLTKSLLGPFLPFLLLPLLRGGSRRERVARSAGTLLALGVTIAPVVLANWREHGRPMIARSARFNAWVGLNDRSPRNFEDEIVTREYIAWRHSAPDFSTRERILAEKIERLLDERGWPAVLRAQVGRQYRRLLHRDSFFTDQLPGGLIHARGGGYPSVPAWATEAWRWTHYLTYGAVLLAAPFGLAAGLAQRRGWALLGGAFVAYHAVIFLVLHVKTRYLMPLLPLFFVAAAVAVAGWARWRVEGGTPPLGAAGAAGAGVVSLLLLGLAFVGG